MPGTIYKDLWSCFLLNLSDEKGISSVSLISLKWAVSIGFYLKLFYTALHTPNVGRFETFDVLKK